MYIFINVHSLIGCFFIVMDVSVTALQINDRVVVDGVTVADMKLLGSVTATGVSVTAVSAQLFWSVDQCLDETDLNSGENVCKIFSYAANMCMPI